MDQDLSWWVHALLAGWQDRTGPRYQRLAGALLEAIDDGKLAPGTRMPPERLLAAALGVSRGTVVAAADRLVEAGAVRRRQGSGSYVVGRPGWSSRQVASGATSILLRQLVDRGEVDLSLSVPGGIEHLPEIDADEVLADMGGHGLEAAGLPVLRERIADYMTENQQLPTTPDQLVVTTGAQQALSLIGDLMALRRATLVAPCPSYPGLSTAFSGRRVRVVPVPVWPPVGPDPDSIARALNGAERPILYLAPSDNPTGMVIPAPRREALLEAAHGANALVIEDLALADLTLGAERPPPPLAALDREVLVVGTVTKLLWAGLRVGWIRAPEPMRDALVQLKAARDLASSVPSQLIAAALLGRADSEWRHRLCKTLEHRRDQLVRSVTERIPAWQIPYLPSCGLSLWVRLPVANSDAFTEVARRHGVTVAPASAMCLCRKHRDHVRLSFAEPPDLLDLAGERLAIAWEAYCEALASVPG